ncbi:MAG: divalent-cation tolerance protein CutA [Candidatus Omnitrophica bacterium]|nr:divalent-cation tolerance protein CutA [Candidatus Omnitrophota bacterium]
MVTAGSREEGEKIASHLLGEKLAACVNLIPGVQSHYWWEGELARAEETLMLIKTTAGHLEALENALNESHGYEIPEFLALPVDCASGTYAAWLRGCLG